MTEALTVEGVVVRTDDAEPEEPDLRNIPWIYVAAAEDRLGLRPDLAAGKIVFQACAERRVSHLVLISSAAVEEPSHHHPQRLTEDRYSRRIGNPLSQQWRELEDWARRIYCESPNGNPRSDSAPWLTILRPTPWFDQGDGSWWSRWLGGRMAFALPGHDPTLQILDIADLAQAVACCFTSPDIGRSRLETYYVAPKGSIPLRKALSRARVLRIPIPGFLQAPMRAALGSAAFGSTGRVAPAAQLAFIRYPWTVDDSKIRRTLGYVPARSSAEAISGQKPTPVYDPFGLDIPYMRRLSATLFRFLHDVWWRVEYRGLEHIPRHGGAVLVGVHRGFQPWDGVMANHLVARKTGRVMRFLVHPALLKFPFLAPFMQKLGGIPACQENGDWVLRHGELLAVFPEGIRGAFRLYNDKIYRLGKMGRDEYVRFALRSGSPIVPFVTVGNAEIYPILRKISWRGWQRFTEWPAFPITPTLGIVPLPTKWHSRFLEPITTDHLPPESAADPVIVSELGEQVKTRMQEALDEMIEQRRKQIGGWFRGSIFSSTEGR